MSGISILTLITKRPTIGLVLNITRIVFFERNLLKLIKQSCS